MALSWINDRCHALIDGKKESIWLQFLLWEIRMVEKALSITSAW
jgi:hypothetical protein